MQLVDKSDALLGKTELSSLVYVILIDKCVKQLSGCNYNK